MLDSEPRCLRGHDDHDWRSPRAVVGSLAEVCSHCGVYRISDGADDSYREADDASRAWIDLIAEGAVRL